MSAGEVEEIIRTRSEKELDAMRWQAQLAWKQGWLNSYAFNDPKKYPMLHTAFSELFQVQDASPKQEDWRILKARMETYRQRRRQVTEYDG